MIPLLRNGTPLPADTIVDRRVLDLARQAELLATDLRCPLHGEVADVALDVADREFLVAASCCAEFRDEVGRRIDAYVLRRGP